MEKRSLGNDNLVSRVQLGSRAFFFWRRIYAEWNSNLKYAIEYVSIQTTGNSVDFGDLTKEMLIRILLRFLPQLEEYGVVLPWQDKYH